MADNEIELSLRIEFFREIWDEESDQSTASFLATSPWYRSADGTREYTGSMILNGAKAACTPRVGEEIRPLNRWWSGWTCRVSRVEHSLSGVTPEAGETAEPLPSICVVMEMEPPDSSVMDQAVADFEAQGWAWHPRGGKISKETELD